ncbi:hypothetical protein HY504_02150 [Candidatus Wolfebacteria bacterium]|nr:hypothetical protein [Candidatus Wolfebacteria bacterium]
MLFYSSLGILLLVLGASAFGGRSFGIGSLETTSRLAELARRIFLIAVVFVFSYTVYLSFAQYRAWLENELSKFLLPSYQGWGYFLFYAGMRFFAPYLLSLAIAGIIFYGMKTVNRRYGERFFYDEEYWFAALAIFLSGHPGWLVYLTALLLVYLLIHLYSLFIIHDSDRISFYYLWLPTGIFAILFIEFYLAKLPFWKLLAI